MLVSAIHQHELAIGYMYVSPLNLPFTSHPSRLSRSTGFELPASYSKFPLAIYCTYGNVYVSMLLSQFVPRTELFKKHITYVPSWLSDMYEVEFLLYPSFFLKICSLLHLCSWTLFLHHPPIHFLCQWLISVTYGEKISDYISCHWSWVS